MLSKKRRDAIKRRLQREVGQASVELPSIQTKHFSKGSKGDGNFNTIPDEYEVINSEDD